MRESTNASSHPVPVEDRRRHPRYLLQLAITLRGDNNFYLGLSEDISEGGIFIATMHRLPIGTPVVLAFTLPHTKRPISVRGRVRWVRDPDAVAGEDDPSTPKPGIGVQFEEADRATLLAIRTFMKYRRPEFYD